MILGIVSADSKSAAEMILGCGPQPGRSVIPDSTTPSRPVFDFSCPLAALG